MLFIIKVFFVININAENETNRFSIKLHIFIKDSLTQKPIPDVTVSLPELQINKQTDANGKVTIKTTKGDFIIITQHISYGYHYHSTVISQDTTLTLYIAPIVENVNCQKNVKLYAEQTELVLYIGSLAGEDLRG